MTESKIIKTLIVSSLILILAGSLAFLKQGRLGSVSQYALKALNKDAASLSQVILETAGWREEKEFLILFQNNLEIRPSGGYLGNFGILKIKNGQILSLETHDTNIFDGFGQIQTTPPQPIQKYLKINNWQMRDSNWSPDFPTTAQKVEDFYHLQGGQEKFDGVIAVNASVLPELLELIGPIYLEKYDKEFTSENVLYELEYEVEKGYVQRNISEGNRKEVFKALIEKVTEKMAVENIADIFQYKDFAFDQLEAKNIMLYFRDQGVQEKASQLGWTGQINKDYTYDYLMINEANLGARKSNYFIERSVKYFIDLNQEKPQVNLKITFKHTGQKKDWFNHDYLCYLRIYAPQDSWLEEAKEISSQTSFSEEFNKTVFGQWIEVPTGQSKTIEFTYTLPQNILNESFYRLMIQKQSGLDSLPVEIKVKTGEDIYSKKLEINQDWQGEVLLEK